MFETLYGKDSSGGIKVWSVAVNDSTITVSHGKLGGKIQTKDTFIKVGKNIGKANETTRQQQAFLEAEAKWVKQQKQGYFKTQAEAQEFEPFSPMKAQDYNDYAHKVVFTGYLQPKLNGMRVMVDSNGEAMSKAGEAYTLPKHIRDAVDYLFDNGCLPFGLDSEVYAGLEADGGLSLQRIVSAFRKENDDTSKLQLHIYDIPVKGIQAYQRMKMLDELREATVEFGVNHILKVVPTVKIEDQGEYDYFHQMYVDLKYEGTMYRNAEGFYEYDKRSYDMIKRKPAMDTEARVLSVEKDKNGQGLLTVELENGTKVKVLMRKDAHTTINYRLYDNAVKLIGEFIKLEFEEYSDAGVPTKPRGIGLRNVRVLDDGTWLVLE